MSINSENICAYFGIICEYLSTTCGQTLATSPPSVNTTLSRAPPPPRHTGKPQPQPPNLLVSTFFSPFCLSFPTPRSRIQGGGVVQMREVWQAHAPHASFPPKLPPGCCLLTHITSSSLRQKQQQQPPY